MLKNLFLAIIAIMTIFSCTTQENLDVLTEVDSSLRSRFPQAEDVTWRSLDNGIYEAAFVNNYTELMADLDSNGQLRTVTSDRNHDGSHDGLDRHHNDVINLDSLCEGVKTYVATNYAGYAITKAYKTNRDSLQSILVLITKDSSKIRLVFDLDCNFVKVATGHVGGGHHGNGHENGHGNGNGDGHHGNGGGHGSSVALDSLPVSIGVYVNANYNSYTLHKAKKLSKDGTTGYVVVIKNADGSYKRLLFDLNGVFVKELK